AQGITGFALHTRRREPSPTRRRRRERQRPRGHGGKSAATPFFNSLEWADPFLFFQAFHACRLRRTFLRWHQEKGEAYARIVHNRRHVDGDGRRGLGAAGRDGGGK